MSIPTYDQLIEPLLRELAEHPDGLRTADAYEGVAKRAGLTEEERGELLPSGTQLVYQNRIGWAHNRLKHAGLSSSARRGYWKLTQEGVEYAAANPGPLAPEVVSSLARVEPGATLKKDSDGGGSGGGGVGDVETQSPEERIEKALSEIHGTISQDLLEAIGESSPLFFEKLVLDLLHAMGYGTSRADLQHTGRSGDGGIDGIISLDRLGMQKVYVQAKRWQGTVGSPQVQTFMGALQLQGATNGVLMTTGVFSRDALDAAERAKGSVVLVDGQRLTALMIEHGVGVSHKALRVPKVDSDYFEEV